MAARANLAKMQANAGDYSEKQLGEAVKNVNDMLAERSRMQAGKKETEGIIAVRAEAANGPGWPIFVADQALHLGVLVACAVAVSGGRSAESLLGQAVLLATDLRAGAVFLAYLLLSRPAGFFIGELTRAWREQLQNEDIHGLENAGLWIGILERWLLLTFLLLGNPGAVGFLIAAKSVFRFGSLTGSGELRKTEYILIGTMASVLFSLIVWIGLNGVLRRLS